MDQTQQRSNKKKKHKKLGLKVEKARKTNKGDATTKKTKS